MTSHDVVQRIRRTLGTRAVGHTGTLDPFATGLLVVLLGRATRLARFIEAQPKQYLATARLGVRTSTDDLTGEVLAASPPEMAIPVARIQEVLAQFHGAQLQQPPQFSAKRVGGERSYRRARRGELVELANVSVTVHRIEMVSYQFPDLSFRALVSAGTYLRAIARDLGQRLGVGAHLVALRRETIGSLRVEDALSLEQLTPEAVLPPSAVLKDLPRVHLGAEDRDAVLHGRAVKDARDLEKRGSGEAVALLEGGVLVAVARPDDGWLRPTVVLDAP